jgi:hydroxymethylpyrimidine pyrophosphatase-like HAD family hydrolase
MECRRCGRCCGPYFSLYVSERDEERWREEDRKDILDRLDWERNRIVWVGDSPCNLETGEIPSRCIYVRLFPDGKFGCAIHDTKPEICRRYSPGSSELCAYYHKPLPYIIGLDLHGTLLEPGEVLRDELVPEIARALAAVREKALVYLCTGNDLSFVDQKVPQDLRDLLDGYVLETGCSISNDKKTETMLTSIKERRRIKELERVLNQQGFAEVNYFGHRLTSIAMFTDDPARFFKKVRGFVEATPFREAVNVIYSSVAVDIIPKGYNKFRGLVAAAQGRKTIGIADSVNDLPLLLYADHAFAPENLAPEVSGFLAHPEDPLARPRGVQPLADAGGLDENKLFVAESRETKGVIEILGFLARHFSPGKE